MENWRTTLLNWFNITATEFTWVEQLAYAGVILLLVVIIDKISKILLNKILTKIVRASKVSWDDILLDRKVLDKLVAIIPAIFLVLSLPFIFVGNETLYSLTQRLCWIYLVGVVLAFIVSALSALIHIFEDNPSFKNKPFKGAVQMVQILFILLGLIIMVSIMINKSPAYLLTGIGASAAILMLVFQDLILGLVAGIHLSANKMMQVGDWVEVKDKGIDGTVIEITLTTVKIQNWNYTVSTIQPQALVSGSFVNWSNMFRSGGRRVARQVHIDVSSVRFLSSDELVAWQDNALLKNFIADTRNCIDKAVESGDKILADTLRITNLTLFRIYVQNYIQSLPTCNKDFISMVRLMEPTPQGIPMQLYFFTNNTAWVVYEGIQSSVFEYVLAVAPDFGIKFFQLPSGNDLKTEQV